MRHHIRKRPVLQDANETFMTNRFQMLLSELRNTMQLLPVMRCNNSLRNDILPRFDGRLATVLLSPSERTRLCNDLASGLICNFQSSEGYCPVDFLLWYRGASNGCRVQWEIPRLFRADDRGWRDCILHCLSHFRFCFQQDGITVPFLLHAVHQSQYNSHTKRVGT